MKAIQFSGTVPRYALGLVLGKLHHSLLWSGLSCTYARELPEPELPGPDWVKIRTRYGGICGTDLANIHLRTSPYYEPLSSSPFTPGHENVGHIVEVGAEAGEWAVGERVVVEPTLWCRPRGFAELCEFCARGEVNRCQHFAEGALSPGVMMGFCRDTGGSWSRYYLAHASQLYRLPEGLSDENALMVEPFACGLHAALLDFPVDDESVLILGAGTIGLVTLAALRALGSKAEILVSARYPFQAEAARRLGASRVLIGEDLYAQVADHSGAHLYKPPIGKRVLVGGMARVYECVGSSAALDDALHLAGTGGKVIVVSIPGIANGVDWTAVFSKELRVRAASLYHHVEPYGGRTWRAFDLALDLMSRGEVDLGWMVTHRYPLDAYKRAFSELGDRRRHAIIKAVFEFEE